MPTRLHSPLPSSSHLVGTTLAGQYRVLSEIGRGGMGCVYEAQCSDGRRVAVKTLSSDLIANEGTLHRFRREAKIIATLEHENIVRYLDVGETPDGQPFLVLELLEGRGLDKEIETMGPLPAGRAVRIALQIAAGLEAAHEASVIHRDLKPENIYLGDNDRVKILDFGVSKLLGPLAGPGTKTGELLGTPNYMAPEQVHDARSADAATDVYGLGGIIYQMLTGRPPFLTSSLAVMLMQIMVESPPSLSSQRPDLPPELASAIERAMSRSPSARWPSMKAFAEAIGEFATIDVPVQYVPLVDPRNNTLTPPSVITTRPPAPAVAKRTSIWMLASVVAVILAGVGLYMKRAHVDAEMGERPSSLTIDFEARADAPSATMQLYGRTYNLPFQGPVERSAALVPVQITAPGRESRTYNVSIREGQKLSASLPEGHGGKDASKEEASKALLVR